MRVVKILTLIATLSFFAPVAHAQMLCGQHAKIIKNLAEKYQESRVAVGVTPRGILEVFRSKAGSFTVIYTRTNGVTCLLAAGEGWEDLKFTEPVGPESVS